MERGGKRMTPIEEMEQLRQELKKASDDYYNGTESMTNFIYDKKFDRLKELEEEYGKPGENFTDTVGAKTDSLLSKVTHEYEAKSLGKSKSVDDLIKEQSKTEEGKEGITCLSWKMDGGTGQLTYQNGKLVLAATRGDGVTGVDITKNAPFIDGIPQTIPFTGKLVVRGEVVMSYAEFDRLNTDGRFANARNLACATMGALDTELLKERHISFKAFEMVYCDKPMHPSFSARLDTLEKFGFGVVEHEVVKISDLKKAIDTWSKAEKIQDLGYPVDGLVVAFDDTEKTKDLEGTGHHPSLTKSMAFKWEDETKKTVLRAIELSPSRTGLLNPVAVFDTVDLCGTKVSRASLHNLSYIENLNLKIGDEITVYKANMIIPQLAENLDKEKAGEKIFSHGMECPCCKNKANIHENNGVKTIVCENEKCLAKELGTFVHFTEKHGMNIEGLSEKSLLLFMENGLIQELSDLFTISEKDREAYTKLEGFGDKAFDNLLKNIEKAKTTDISHFLYACGIDGVGRGQLKEIIGFLQANYDTTLKDYHNPDGSYDLLYLLTKMQEDNFDFTKINGIGNVLAGNFSDFIEKEFIHEQGKGFSDCLPYLTFTDKPMTQDKTLPLAGKTFCITGKLEHFDNRDAMVQAIESLGGKVAGSVSKNTDYLINNDVNSTSGKNKKAMDLGIPIMSEDMFLSEFMKEKEEEIER